MTWTSHLIYQVDAFADRLFEGNPAAVLILDKWLPDALMHAIAAEMNLAETSFIKKAGTGWDLRWFAPLTEVDFCGHATLAAAHILATELRIGGDMSFNTRVGRITVTSEQGNYRMRLPIFAPEPLATPPAILQKIFANQHIVTFRNFENLFVQLADEQSVRAFEPDFALITKLHPQGLAITAQGSSDDFVSRYFAPGFGIPEDPVTGSIHATLVPYWARKLGKPQLVARQISSRGGRLICEMAGDHVSIEGRAITFMRGQIMI